MTLFFAMWVKDNEQFFKVGFIGTVSNEDSTPSDNYNNEWTADLEVNNTLINFKIDTGALSKFIAISSVFKFTKSS